MYLFTLRLTLKLCIGFLKKFAWVRFIYFLTVKESDNTEVWEQKLQAFFTLCHLYMYVPTYLYYSVFLLLFFSLT